MVGRLGSVLYLWCVGYGWGIYEDGFGFVGFLRCYLESRDKLLLAGFSFVSTSCVTISCFFTFFGHSKTLLRYRFLLFYFFRTRKDPLALPFSAFLLFSGTQGPSCVTVFSLFTLFRARKDPLALPFTVFSPFSGTQGPSCVTVSCYFTFFGHTRTLLRYRFQPFYLFRARKDPLALPVFCFFTFFGHVRTLLRYRFQPSPIWSRKDPLVLPFSVFSPFSGTQGPSCVTNYLLYKGSGHATNHSIVIIFLAVTFPFSIQSGIPTP
jgi:hypothetical protein